MSHPVQIALAEYLKEPLHYQELSGFYQQKRDLFLDLIKDSRFNYVPSQGTYFQSLNYTSITDELDTEFAKKLTIDNGIATIPMSVFNDKGVDYKVLRFCFAKTDETLQKAAEIINSI